MTRLDSDPFDVRNFIKELEAHIENTPGLSLQLDKERLSGDTLQYRYKLQGSPDEIGRIANEIDRLEEHVVVRDRVQIGFGKKAHILIGVIVKEEPPKIKRIQKIPDFLEFIKDVQTIHPDWFQFGERNVSDDR